ncbi:BrxA/BrxB family bacilliredoxin [bacterium]|nr:BrxA/BrxB family bacilliredoxin [bacterium]
MPYDERLVSPMRQDLTRIGFKELRNAAEVEDAIKAESGTTLVVVNSVCGCAAGMARPGVALSLNNKVVPNHLTTVFAGQDIEAVSKVRSMIPEIPPSSPSVLLFKDGKLLWTLQRFEIEGHSASEVAGKLTAAYDDFCS